MVTLILGNVLIFADAALIKDLDKSSSYAKQAISELSGKDIIKGDDYGNFYPQDSITRAQMITMIVRVLELDIKKLPENATFKDVPKNHWAFPYVEAAYREGIVTGVSKDIFGVNEINTREQMAAMFVRGLGITEADINKDYGTEKIDKLADKSKISGWSKSYVEYALSTGLMTGTSSKTFGPKDSAKREQAAVVTHRFINNMGEELAIDEFAAFKESIVMLESYDNEGNIMYRGSGFSISKGLFLTSYHVLEGSSKHIITDSKGNRFEVQGIVKYDADLDFAVIKTVEPIDITPLQAGSINSIESGDRIVAISNPQGLLNEISEGNISEIRNIEYGDTDSVDLILTNAPLGPVSSGGALFDMKGNVIGIITTIPEDGSQKHVIPINHAKGWIQELKATPFESVTVLDMSEVIKSYLDISDESIKAVINNAFQAMEGKNLEAYMAEMHKFNPSYREMRKEFKEVFIDYDFDFDILEIEILEKAYEYAEVDVLYTFKNLSNPQDQNLYKVFGEYTLLKENGRYKILLAYEEIQTN
jgi:S1-C subfamily serine protease